MRVLILTHRVPFPQNGGYPIVVGNTIKGLVNHGHQVSLISININKHNDRAQTRDELLDHIRYTEYKIDTRITVAEFFSNLFTTNAYKINKYHDQAFEKILIKDIQENHYDIIQFEGLFVAPYLSAIRKATKARLVFRSHNIEHQVWHKLAQQKSDPIKRWFLHQIAKRVKRYELGLLNQFDGILVFTGQDEHTMTNLGNKTPICVLPIGVELGKYKPDYSRSQFPSMFFLGSLDWLPNKEGIEWFLDNFHKEIVDGDINARFYLAGNNIPEEYDEYDAMGKVFIQGELDDALEFINSRSIMIVPLLSGGGMRVKIIEGMAMQKCIISTSIGAEGILAEHGKNIIIANNADEFYKAMLQCISNEDYCKQIGQNARKLIEELHDVDHITGRLIHFYQSILN
ncbi:glycosyltransferase family 4 protein [Mucilaginibacter pallidiroseus]|uniref:glycosyltransferase family 4 protein n=1 Tax=Mucilaginibacter pallidiroseus TaxID=2599295 RepID=UPI00164948A9|nr:glycosyltransferase family 4 protein [Mucilaginibacter pallidiroseus]